MLKSSYKSSSTSSLYEFADELSTFNKPNAAQKKEDSAQIKSDTTNNTNTIVPNCDFVD